MVGVDVFIEPVAMANDFWSWKDDVVPMQNYLGWGILSFLLFLGLFRWIRV
jgi:putative membrane protein